MGGKIDRTGEERLNKFGSKMVIKEYRKAIDIDIYFPEYDWTFKHTRYNDFKKGKLNVLMNLDIMVKAIWVKESIKLKKMVKIQMNIKYGMICYEDATVLSIKKNNLLIKGVQLKNTCSTFKIWGNGLRKTITKFLER